MQTTTTETFTLKSLLDGAKTGTMSAQGISNLREDILAGKFDAMGQTEGLTAQLEALKNKAGKKTVEAPGFLQKAAEVATTTPGVTPEVVEKSANVQVGLTTDIKAPEPEQPDQGLIGDVTSVLNPVEQSIGLAKETGELALDAGQLGELMIKTFGRVLTPKEYEAQFGFSKEQKTGAEKLSAMPQVQDILEAKTTGQNVFKSGVHGALQEATKMGLNAASGVAMGTGNISGSQQLKSLGQSEYLQPKNAYEKGGAVAADIAAFMFTGSAASGLTPQLAASLKGTTLGTKLLGTSPVLTKALVGATTQGIAGTGTASLQTGELGAAELTTGAISAAFPLLGGAFKGAMNPERLMGKALGLTKGQTTKMNGMLKGSEYDNISDFALKNGLIGGRQDFVTQADDLFSAATSSKKGLLGGITTTVKNEFDEAFDYLKTKYAVPGQKESLQFIEDLAQKAELTASELDDVRYLIDASIPKGAYTGAEPVATKGIQNLVDPIRKLLGELDTTGKLKSINKEIQVLYELMPKLANATSSDVMRQMLFRNAFRLLTFGPISALTGGVPSAVSTAFGLADAATDIPIVASYLAQLLKNSGDKLPIILLDTIKAALSGTAKEVTKEVLAD